MPVGDHADGGGTQANVPEAAAEWPSLTLAQGLLLQKELYDAFVDDDFQDQLEEVEATHGKACRNHTPEHTRLFLAVQDGILPKYGFARGQKGVIQMLRAGAELNGDAQYARNRATLNQLLGLAEDAEDREESGDGSGGQAAEHHQACSQAAGADGVEILVRHLIDGTELRVSVPRAATFYDVREAISRKVGRGEILTRGHLMRKDDGAFADCGDDEPVGGVRQVLVLKASLRVHDDEEASAHRQDLGPLPVPAPLASRLQVASAAPRNIRAGRRTLEHRPGAG
mmetsp:Transcript_27943/g.79016  ORF Transcript_27943/g.79016 Transcript_27943/m.79016 type:complete len:284 (-) Transcript_27943:74-925(-)